ncbi:MAG: hypothetical protein ACTHMC_27945 [Pseudobacter sp.]|uniref:hypothetical protein n=1 Tax=Pseudobacter sp. TaxID=2045420 RepID=UPI003F7D9A54
MNLGADALRKAALNLEARELVLSNPALYQTLLKAADRYIGGENLGETVQKVSSQAALGYKTSLGFMGESIKTDRIAEYPLNLFRAVADIVG